MLESKYLDGFVVFKEVLLKFRVFLKLLPLLLSSHLLTTALPSDLSAHHSAESSLYSDVRPFCRNDPPSGYEALPDGEDGALRENQRCSPRKYCC